WFLTRPTAASRSSALISEYPPMPAGPPSLTPSADTVLAAPSGAPGSTMWSPTLATQAPPSDRAGSGRTARSARGELDADRTGRHVADAVRGAFPRRRGREPDAAPGQDPARPGRRAPHDDQAQRGSYRPAYRIRH